MSKSLEDKMKEIQEREKKAEDLKRKIALEKKKIINEQNKQIKKENENRHKIIGIAVEEALQRKLSTEDINNLKEYLSYTELPF